MPPDLLGIRPLRVQSNDSLPNIHLEYIPAQERDHISAAMKGIWEGAIWKKDKINAGRKWKPQPAT
jgi:hypothetical protein